LNNVASPRETVVKIRPMAEADLGLVIALEEQIFSDPWPASSFRELLDNDQWGALVAELDGGIIGYACYMIVLDEAHLTNIAVIPDYRRKSVAQQLLDRILWIVNKDNCELLLLEVRPSNEAAIRFYKKHQFAELYRRPNYYRRPVEDALVMVRYLRTD